MYGFEAEDELTQYPLFQFVVKPDEAVVIHASHPAALELLPKLRTALNKTGVDYELQEYRGPKKTTCGNTSVVWFY